MRRLAHFNAFTRCHFTAKVKHGRIIASRDVMITRFHQIMVKLALIATNLLFQILIILTKKSSWKNVTYN